MIFIDFREQRCQIPDTLQKWGIQTSFDNLKVGDYVIPGSPIITVERKEVGDFIASKESGHLDSQLYELSTNCSNPWLIIVGDIREELMRRKKDIFSYISSLMGGGLKTSPDGFGSQIQIVQVNHDFEAALAIRALHEKVSSGDLVRLPLVNKAKYSKSDRVMYILSSFSNVGEVRAREALKTFGSLEAVFGACLHGTLDKAKGWGPKTVQSMVELLREEYK